jgi:hypothetical protein
MARPSLDVTYAARSWACRWADLLSEVLRRGPEYHNTNLRSSENLKPYTRMKVFYFETKVQKHLQTVELSCERQRDMFLPVVKPSDIGMLRLGLLDLVHRPVF